MAAVTQAWRQRKTATAQARPMSEILAAALRSDLDALVITDVAELLPTWGEPSE